MSADLDPQARAVIDAAAASGMAPLYTLPVEEARQLVRAGSIQAARETLKAPVDLTIAGPAGGIASRLYHPEPGAVLPLIVFFHGGGWVVGDLDTHDHMCAELAEAARCAVLSVDYRRAPEAKYPAAVDDAYAALVWAVENAQTHNADAEHVAVAGDSAGGNLAAAVALLARDRGGPVIRYQVLFYPVTDYLDPPSASYIERATGYSLNRDFMQWAFTSYLPQTWDRDDPYLFPLRAATLESLPAALILTAEFDPLRDEGAAYAQRLADAGVPVTHWHFDDQMHGFVLQSQTISRAAQAIADVGAHLQRALKA